MCNFYIGYWLLYYFKVVSGGVILRVFGLGIVGVVGLVEIECDGEVCGIVVEGIG